MMDQPLKVIETIQCISSNGNYFHPQFKFSFTCQKSCLNLTLTPASKDFRQILKALILDIFFLGEELQGIAKLKICIHVCK